MKRLERLKKSKLLNRLFLGFVLASFLLVSLDQFLNPANAGNTTAVMNPGATPDYFGTVGNYANSPLPELDAAGNVIPGTGIRKFVDSLPGLGAANANNLGQYIPVAIPDTTTYPGSDYYEIDLVEYSEQMHSDLPATKLRGYVQVNTSDPTVSKPHYLGPMIIAHKDRPVRVKFTNRLPTGSAGDLFIPVDTTVMGAGMGPNGMDMYTQNRATLHLHGGITPWISDGTPHQWITPADEKTPYPKGVSVQNVPDMPDPGPGSQTFFYTNQQSARLMFYHDHSYGITRLNVYAGEAAGYILRDATEENLIASGVLPKDEVPLIIQDKTFVPKENQLAAQDPTWDSNKWSGFGGLWFPHVYMTNQNPYDNSGSNPVGRWDYGPWFWPPYTGLQHGPVANPLYGTNAGEPPMNPGVPDVSQVPEAFMDTPVVNGTAYPYLNVEPKAYRFRILNASNDRFLNLQLYTAKSDAPMWDPNGKLLNADAGEVPMVDAIRRTGYPSTWPTDGRDGGVPDPAASGPKMIQIGTEGGFLPNPVEIMNQPVGYDYNRRSITVLNVTDKALFLGSAERADVVVDFSKFAGKTLILYNDSPAPVPAGDPRIDYYTGNPDMTDTGGAPSTLPGYGPNTRTIMQIKVADVKPAGYKLDSVTVTNGGSGYTAPEANISGSTGTGAAVTVKGSVDKVTVTNSGTGYTSAPTATVSGVGTTTNAAIKATLKVESIALTNGGAGYTSAPTVTITDASGSGSGATATATIDAASGAVTGITLVNPGSGYTTPVVNITGGGASTNAAATLTGTVDEIKVTDPGAGYATAPVVSISGGGAATDATATASLKITDIVLTDAGSGYIDAPTVTITDPTGTGATAVAVLANPLRLLNKAFPAAFNESQNPILVPEGTYARIQDTKLTFTPEGSTTPLTLPMQPKAIQELFTTDYGRMNSTLGVELPNTSATIQTTIPLGYVDPATEIIDDNITAMSPVAGDGTQIWKITHNGVDTHAIHFHLFDVQLLNRVGWDGAIKPPDENERGWKDTVRMNPLEDCIVALRPVSPKVNFGIPDSVRALDPTMPLGSQTEFTQIDPKTGNPLSVINKIVNFGWEYVWHCHLLGHEENDMMRPIVFNVARALPAIPALGYTRDLGPVNLTWTDGTPANDPASMGNPSNEIGYRVERAAVDKAGKIGTYVRIGQTLANTTTYSDSTADPRLKYSYRVIAYNAAGTVTSNTVTAKAMVEAPTNLTGTVQSGPKVSLTWTDNATNETGFIVERAANGGPFVTVATPGPRTGTGNLSYTDTTVASGTSYEYRVYAVYGAFVSDYSNTISLGVNSPVAAPSSLKASLQSGPKVLLTWNDNASNETGFLVERAVNGGAFATIATPAARNGQGNMSYTDTTVTFGNTYDYRVRAVRGTILSAYPSPATVSIPSLPAAPSGLSVTAARAGRTSDTATLNWVDNADNETGFTVQIATNATFTNGTNTRTLAANTVNTQFTGLSRARTYYFRVQSFNSSGASAWSDPVSIVTP